MPAKSVAQQRFMGMVHSAQKKGGKAASPEVAKTAKSIKKKDAKDFASTKHKGLPKKITEDSTSDAKEMKGSVWKDKTREDKPWAAKHVRTGKISYFNTKQDAVKYAGYKTMGRMHEAKDETMRQRGKGKAPRGYDQPSWDWRIHSKGSYWQSRPSSGTGLKVPGWGARAKTGEVDYFPDKSKAMQFADWANPNTKPGSYVRGNFAKGKTEGGPGSGPTRKNLPSKKRAVDKLAKKSLGQLRKMQDMVDQQMARAYKQNNTQGLGRLQAMRSDLDMAVDRKAFGESRNEGRHMNEDKDETSIQRKKGRPPKGYDASSWEWRIHSKGSYWQSPPNNRLKNPGWGARAKSGQVDYFPDRGMAVRFANYTHSSN